MSETMPGGGERGRKDEVALENDDFIAEELGEDFYDGMEGIYGLDSEELWTWQDEAETDQKEVKSGGDNGDSNGKTIIEIANTDIDTAIDKKTADEAKTKANHLLFLRKQVVNFIASGGDFWYLKKKETPSQSEAPNKKAAGKEKIWEKDVLRLLSGKFIGGIREREAYEFVLELVKKMLQKIPGATELDEHGMEEVWAKLKDDEAELKVLGYLLKGERGFAAYERIDIDDLAGLVKEFKTPLDLEWRLKQFRQDLKEDNKKAYLEATERLLGQVYGEKMEYYAAIKRLEEEAYEKYRKELGEQGVIVEGANKHPMVSEVGIATVNKLAIDTNGKTVRDKAESEIEAKRPNQDAAYVNTELGLCAVADGAGAGGGDPTRAARIVINSLRAASNSTPPETVEDLKRFLELANKRVGDDAEAGVSTAAVAKIVKKGRGYHLIFANVGDSRIYLVRNNKRSQLTTDEGEGNLVTNVIGTEDGKIKQTGEIALRWGDVIVLNSDGVTGDSPKQAVAEEKFVSAASKGSAKEAAENLVRAAKKRDDRTAIVIRMENLRGALGHRVERIRGNIAAALAGDEDDEEEIE